MDRQTFVRECTAAPAEALRRAVHALEADGYQVASRGEAETHLVHQARRERLALRLAGAQLVFEFSPLVPGAALAEPPQLERLVERATGSGGGGVPRRCSVCAAIAPDGAVACPVCGGRVS
jgi:hypothetical protein